MSAFWLGAWMWAEQHQSGAITVELEIIAKGDNAYTISMRVLNRRQGGLERLVSGAQVTIIKEELLRLQNDSLDYGKRLSEMLFATADLREDWRVIQRKAREQERTLRFQLALDERDPALHSLRWETLCDPRYQNPFARSDQVLLSRCLANYSVLHQLPSKPNPLRTLAVIAAPVDAPKAGYALIDAEAERRRVRTALGNMEPEILASSLNGPRVTPEELTDRLRAGYDVLYLLSHGMMVEDEPVLLLEDEAGKCKRIMGKEIILAITQRTKVPFLVILASCDSAGEEYDTMLNALGPQLVKAGVPAVLAMQGKISLDIVEKLMSRFFSELQDHGRVDYALAVARNAVAQHPDWWRPVLYIHLPEGRLWRDKHQDRIMRPHRDNAPTTSADQYWRWQLSNDQDDQDDQVSELVTALKKCESMYLSTGRKKIFAQLPEKLIKEIRLRIPSGLPNWLDALVTLLLKHPWGMEAFLDSVRESEGNSDAMARVDDYLKQIHPVPIALTLAKLAPLKLCLSQAHIEPGDLRERYLELELREIPTNPLGRNWLLCYIDQLARLRHEPTTRHPLLRFLESLAPILPAELRPLVEDWCKNAGVVLGEPSQPQPVSAAPSVRNAPEALLIDIEEVQARQFCMRVYWWRGQAELVYADDECIRFADLRAQVLKRAFEATLKLNNDRKPETPFRIEMLLPDDLLHEPVDSWTFSGDPEPIGAEQQIVVRSRVRLLPDQSGRLTKWKERWGNLAVKQAAELVGYLRSHDECRSPVLLSLLKQHDLFVMLCHLPEASWISKHLAHTLRSEGVPVAIWPQDATASAEQVQEKLERLLITRPLNELPAALLEYRQSLYVSAADTHMSPQLSLLWDDPDRTLPQGRMFTPPAVRGASQ